MRCVMRPFWGSRRSHGQPGSNPPEQPHHDRPVLGVNSMPILRMLCAILFAVGYLGSMEAQEAPIPQLSPGSARKPASASRLQTTPSSPQSVLLYVPRGTPLQVALDQEIRVKRVGQP